MKLGLKTGCHQYHDRSFSINGYQFPVCTRCTGLFIGQVLGLATSYFYNNFNVIYILFLAALFFILLGIDGIGQYKNKWISTNRRRFLTGISCGYFVIIFIINCITKALENILVK